MKKRKLSDKEIVEKTKDIAKNTLELGCAGLMWIFVFGGILLAIILSIFE